MKDASICNKCKHLLSIKFEYSINDRNKCVYLNQVDDWDDPELCVLECNKFDNINHIGLYFYIQKLNCESWEDYEKRFNESLQDFRKEINEKINRKRQTSETSEPG